MLSDANKIKGGEVALQLSHFFLFISVPFAFYEKHTYNTFVFISLGCFLIAHILLSKMPAPVTRLFYFFIGYYIVQVAGLMLTQNMKQGLQELDTSSAILAFPTVIFLSPRIDSGLIRMALILLVGSALFGGITMHASVIKDILATGKPLSSLLFDKKYQYTNIADILKIHPSYLSILFFVSLYIIFKVFFKNSSLVIKILLMVLAAYFVLVLTLLLSRGPWIAFIGSALLSIVFFAKNKYYFIGLGVFAVLFAASLLLYKPLKERFIEPIFTLHFDYTEEPNMKSVSWHLLSWRCALQSADTPGKIVFGHGVGDEIDEMLACYHANQNELMAVMRLSAHNDYLTQFVKNGLIGMLLLISFFVITARTAFQRKNVSTFFMICMFALASIFESYLNVRLGVFYFAFLIPFFWRMDNDKNEDRV